VRKFNAHPKHNLQLINAKSVYALKSIFHEIHSSTVTYKNTSKIFHSLHGYTGLTDKKEKFKKVSLNRFFGKERSFAKNYAQ